jgi:nitrogen regulatory protein PII-like uncharacterized protein
MRFEIAVASGGINLQTYTVATTRFLQLLREIDSAISGKGGGMVNWYIVNAKRNEGIDEEITTIQNLAIEIESKLKPPPRRPRKPIRDTGNAVAQSFVTGFDNIEHRGISPPYLSEFGLERLQDMMHLLHRNGAKGFTAEIVGEHRAVSVSEQAARTLSELLPAQRAEEGAVEGALETISVHKKKKLVIYDSLTGKGVTCLINKDDLFDIAAASLGKKVIVAGKVFYNVKDEPLRIQVRSIRVLGTKRLPTVAELTGSDPEFTGSLTTDEYIRSVRRG